MFALSNPWRDYAWGSPTALPDFLRVPPPGGPVAEIWMGTHPLAPSRAEDAGGSRPLSELSGDLSFMVKLLAADRPLSIQVHPNRSRAERGYAAEEAAGLAREAPERNYKDRRAKPEMIYALSTFDTLVGFRPTAEILRLLAPIDTHLSRLLAGRLAADPGFAGIVRLVEFILTDSAVTAADLAELLVRCEELIAAGVDVKRAYATALDVAEHHRRDRGLAVSLLLNRLTLQPGEAAFLDAGIIHAHLRGMCVEVQECSDNVVRAGLTSKHVDVAELIANLDEGMARLARVTPELREPATEVFTVDADSFALAVTQCAAGAMETTRIGPVADRIVVCLGGEAIVIDEAGEKHTLSRGESLYADAADGLLSLSGTCEVAVAYRPGGPGAGDRLVDLV